MDKIQELTFDQVTEACRKAYKENGLLAQHPELRGTTCVYHYGEYKCAVGVALSQGTLDWIDRQFFNEKNFRHLVTVHMIRCSSHDSERISWLQTVHDAWFFEQNPGKRAEREENFKQAIGL